MRRYMPFNLVSLISAFFVCLAAPFVGAVSIVLDQISPQIDARTHVQLEAALRGPTVIQPLRSRARAFVERCLTHDLFTGRHFDPGRMPA